MKYQPTGPLQHYAAEGDSNEAKAVAFRQCMQELLSVGLTVKSPERQPLTADMVAYRGDKLRFASVRFSPHSTVSSPSQPSNDARLLVSLHKKGPALVSQGGRESRIEAGDIFIIDPTRPFYIETGEIETCSVYIHAAALRSLASELDLATARAIRCDRGVSALLRSAIEELFTHASSITDDVADDIADALLHLLAPVVRSCVSATERCPSRLAAMHRQRIVRFVRENLGDASLDASTIAQGVNLSARHVYQLFENDDKPLMRWVWSERLERCRRDLGQPGLRARSIGEIAFQWGFSNVSHFSRSFKSEYGVTPREFRQRSLDAALLEPLAA